MVMHPHTHTPAIDGVPARMQEAPWPWSLNALLLSTLRTTQFKLTFLRAAPPPDRVAVKTSTARKVRWHRANRNRGASRA